MALVLTCTAYVAEVLRAGIESVHPSQRAAARALGLGHAATLRHVVLPQAVRRVLPALLNDLVSLQEDSGLVSVLGVVDAIRADPHRGGGELHPLPRHVSVLRAPDDPKGAGHRRRRAPLGHPRHGRCGVSAEAPLLSMRGVRKAYGRTVVLDGLDLDVAAHRCVVLIGAFGRAPTTCPGGQQQRVAIARSLVDDPVLMLFDEVTSALDPELVAEVLGLLRELRQDGVTMVVATHEMGSARRVANEVCFLDGGRVLERGAPQQVLEDPREPRTRAFLRSIVAAGRR